MLNKVCSILTPWHTYKSTWEARFQMRILGQNSWSWHCESQTLDCGPWPTLLLSQPQLYSLTWGPVNTSMNFPALTEAYSTPQRKLLPLCYPVVYILWSTLGIIRPGKKWSFRPRKWSGLRVLWPECWGLKEVVQKGGKVPGDALAAPLVLQNLDPHGEGQNWSRVEPFEGCSQAFALV